MAITVSKSSFLLSPDNTQGSNSRFLDLFPAHTISVVIAFKLRLAAVTGMYEVGPAGIPFYRRIVGVILVNKIIIEGLICDLTRVTQLLTDQGAIIIAVGFTGGS